MSGRCTLSRHLLFGVRTACIDEVVQSVASRLGCTFQERESDYLGTYWLATIDEIKVRIVSQPDPEGDPLEDDYDEYGTLVYVDSMGEGDVPDLNGLPVALERLTLLRDE